MVLGLLDNFKINLGKYISTVPDKPPVTSYKTTNKNSVLDWSNQSGGI